MRLKRFETYFFKKLFLIRNLFFFFNFYFIYFYFNNNNSIILKKRLNVNNQNFIFNNEERLNNYQLDYSYFRRFNCFNGYGGIIFSDKKEINLKLNNCIF